MHQKTVLELITDRAFAKNNGTTIDDGAHLTLAVEGGAMRGIISAGMLLALYDLDLLELFDSYVGVSAGSMNLVYTLAGQGALGVSIYFEDMNHKDIVNLLRFRSKEHPILDLRKLYDHTVVNKPLNMDVLNAKYHNSLKVAVFNVTTDQGELITIDSADFRFFEFLLSGAILPFISGEPWLIRGSRYFDGGLFYIDPAECAVEMKATHTFVLNTRAQNKPLKISSKLVQQQMRWLNDDYYGAGMRYVQNYTNAVNVFGSLPFGETELDGMKLYRHALPQYIGVNRATRDPEKLVAGLKEGYKSIIDIFYQQGRVGIIPTLM